jgi:hypothetical protein
MTLPRPQKKKRQMAFSTFDNSTGESVVAFQTS